MDIECTSNISYDFYPLMPILYLLTLIDCLAFIEIMQIVYPLTLLISEPCNHYS